MNVLSLFDGMSCGMLALERAGIHVNKYYASEIDKYAIKVSQANYPEIIRKGDITKWKDWDVDWGSIDLVIGGSPCQGFSFAGKQLAFDDPRSKLFFTYVEILNHIKKVNSNVKFLLENVKMKQDYLDEISRLLGVNPVCINSALVSAQNRVRYYWCNWEVTQPKDKKLFLRDILEYDDCDRDKSCGSIRGRKINSEGKRDDYNPDLKAKQRIEIRTDGKTNCLSTVQKDNVVVINSGKDKNPKFTDSYMQLDPNNKGNNSVCNRVNLLGSKHKALSGTLGGNKHGVVLDKDKCLYRKLTPVECERLQTVPDNYTNYVSNTQRYKMLGNGWTVDIITHIFNELIRSFKCDFM